MCIGVQEDTRRHTVEEEDEDEEEKRSRRRRKERERQTDRQKKGYLSRFHSLFFLFLPLRIRVYNQHWTWTKWLLARRFV
jgi:CRISPR/Cas system CMR subunit Cmr4 (Cas7 group RAMP superfamily)